MNRLKNFIIAGLCVVVFALAASLSGVGSAVARQAQECVRICDDRPLSTVVQNVLRVIGDVKITNDSDSPIPTRVNGPVQIASSTRNAVRTKATLLVTDTLQREVTITLEPNDFTGTTSFTVPQSRLLVIEARDIRLSDNFGGLRFYGAPSLTTSPAGAAIQFFGNNASPFNGQLYLDSGALNSAALIFRTAGTGGTITERMRVTSNGRVLIGTTVISNAALRVVSTGANGIEDALTVQTSASGGIGVYGLANNVGGVGVWGAAPGGSGVAVRGTASPSGFAGQFTGNVQVSGNLSKGGGSFKIDHPLDPANKYLSHSFVESPDMLNIYNGIIVLDAKGEATVTLPAYFEALNREFRYQLTAIGAPGPNLYIAKKIKGRRFRIAGGKRGMEVSWQVTGVRQDAYAEAHRIKVEEDKPAPERGTYLHPEAFGQPPEKSAARLSHPQPKQQIAEAPAKQPSAP